MIARLRRAVTGPASDRGSMTLWMVLIGVALLLGLGLSIDGAEKVAAGRRAEVAAAEAARAAAQHPAASSVGGNPSVDAGQGAAAARSYLAAAGVPGSVRVSGDLIVVTTSVAWQPRFLPLPGQTLTGTATVRRTSV